MTESDERCACGSPLRQRGDEMCGLCSRIGLPAVRLTESEEIDAECLADEEEERIRLGLDPVRDRCQFCLGHKGGIRDQEVVVDGVLVCEECAELLRAMADVRSSATDVTDAVKRGLVAAHNTGTSLQLMARFPVARADMQASWADLYPAQVLDDMIAVGVLIRELVQRDLDEAAANAVTGAAVVAAAARAREHEAAEQAGTLVSLVTPFGGTVTDPEELALYTQLQEQNISRCATCNNTGWGIEGQIYCECPYGVFLALKTERKD